MSLKNYKFNLIKSPKDDRDWKLYATYNNIIIPDLVDHRKDLLSIRDQGEQGSCVAMAGSCMKEWQEKKDYGLIEHMSPQFIYNNRENQDSEGMFLRDLLKILQKIGCVLEKEYPYGLVEKKELIYDHLFDMAKHHKIDNYVSIDSIDELKRAIFVNGPCIIAFPVYNFTKEFWKKQVESQSFLGGHAVAVVGYNKEGFIIRNSWSKHWGFDGYSIYTYDDFLQNHHWEIWSTIDAESIEKRKEDEKPVVNKLNIFQKLVKWFMGLFK